MARKLETLYRTKYLTLVSADGWEWVSRPNPVVCIAAMTDDGNVLLVEQFRKPVDARVIELPAGLAGDGDSAGEPLVEAARRELLEETGYEAAELREALVAVTSAGLTDETTTFFVAKGLRKVEDTSGVDGEKIVQHLVPYALIDSWLAERRRAGIQVDARVYTGLHLLRPDA